MSRIKPHMRFYEPIQEYNAIRVQSPKWRHRVNDPQPETEQPQPATPNERRTPDRNSDKVSHLISQQERLLDHQKRVAQQQDLVASKLSQQNEMLTQALIQKMFENKDNIIANLSHMRADQMEEYTRQLLQEHIRYMAAIVQRLNQDIEGLEADLKARDLAVVSTNGAVGKLEVHHITMLQDLKSRIVRCDTSITKHSADLRFILEELRRLEGQQVHMKEEFGNLFHRLEAEILSITGELERQSSETRHELIHQGKDIDNKITNMDGKMQAQITDVRSTIHDFKLATDSEREKMERRFQMMLEKATTSWNAVMEKVDRRLEESHFVLEARLQKLEDTMAIDRQKLAEIQRAVETKVINQLNAHMANQEQELHKAKMEFRDGFTSVHDSIRNMKTVVEGKRKLMADQLRKEIGQIRKILQIEMPNNPDDWNTQKVLTVTRKNPDDW
ncbi:hypothetical protein CHS0354_018182 [Potamilus streckersoni]|uniref:Uncharacterized protein n=1 Tax=Potamilus streckersoni TaxID=2493646 RepID=A0AAE0SAM2_9BIVA|nr:hypothetical protein CHS0354_018182 [Potamilus streckersoni]